MPTLKKDDSQITQRLPLRLVLILPFVLQITLAVGLTAYFSLKNGQRAVNDLALQLMDQIGKNISYYLEYYCDTPHLINQANADAAKIGILDLKNIDQTRRYLLQQIQRYPEVGYIYYVGAKGDAFGAEYRQGKYYNTFVNPSQGKPLKAYEYIVDPQGNNQKLSKVFDYDGRTDACYKLAKKNQKARWTDLYAWPYTWGNFQPNVSIDGILPIADQSGKLTGVWGVSLTVSAINKYLQKLKIGKNGQVMIMERSGKLIGASNSQTYAINNLGKPNQTLQQFLATDIKQPLLKGAAIYLQEKFGKLSKIENKTQDIFLLNGQRNFVTVVNFQDGRGLDWLVLLVIPESDFMEQINANRNMTIILCFLSLLGATILGWFTSQKIAKPIYQLSMASRAISQGKLTQKVQVRSIKELAILADSFNQMSQQLLTSRQQLEEYSQSLETKVAERTEALETEVKERTQAENALHHKNLILIKQNQVLQILANDRDLLQGNLTAGIPRLTELTAQTLNVEMVSIWLQKSEDERYWSCLDVFDLNSQEHRHLPDIDINKYPNYKKQLETEQIIATTDVEKDPRVSELMADYFTQLSIVSSLEIPLRRNCQTRGIFCIESTKEKRLWIPEEQNFARSVGNLVALAIEINQRLQAEIALKNSEQRYRTLYEDNQDAILLLDVEKQGFSDCNQAGLKLYGAESLTDIIGKNPLNFSPEKQTNGENSFDLAFYHHEQALTKGNHRFEWLHQRLSGEEFIGEVWLTALELEGRKILQTVVRDISDRKLAERQLRQSEANLVAAQRIAHLGSWEYNLITGKITWSLETFNIYGLDPAQGEPTMEELVKTFLPNDYDPWRKIIYDQVINDGKSFEFSYGLVRPDGQIRYVESRGEPIFNQTGQVIGLFGTVNDVTSRKLMEMALRLSEERWELALKGTNDGIWDWNLTNNQVFFSPRWKEMLGYSEAEIDNNYDEFYQKIHPEDRELVEQNYQAHLRGETPYYAEEIRLQCKDGSYKWILSRGQAVRDETGKPIRIVGSNTDISDRKKREEALKLLVQGTASVSGQQCLQNIVQNLAKLLDVRYSMISEFVEGTKSRARSLAYWQGEEFGENITYDLSDTPCDLVRQHEVCHFESNIQKIFPKDLELVNLNAQGYWGTTLKNATGKTIGLLNIFDVKPLPYQEITESILKIFAARAGAELERQQAEVALQQAKDKAESASQAKSEFLANMSHELRTPLNGILGYTQILQQDTTMTPEQSNAVNVIHQSGSHLLTLINDLLDLSKIEVRKMELLPKDFHLPNFLQGVVEMCRIRAEQKGIGFVYQTGSALPVAIHSDEKRLRQVLLNLLGNAIKFTDHGEVTFSVTNIGYNHDQNKDRHQISPLMKIRFQIEDTGVGINTTQVDQIFLPFEQVGEKSRKATGTGLGLAISQKIIEMMGSNINVNSKLGQGSVFWFDLELLPAAEWLSVNTQKTKNEKGGKIQGVKGKLPQVLLVDDKWENCAFIVNLLQPIGIQIETASNGQEALDKIDKLLPDLIITDLIMPVMDGFELIKKIRANSQLAHAKIIISSASISDLDQSQTRSVGGDDFLSKPVQANELFEKLQKFLNLEWVYAENLTQEIKPETPNTPKIEIVSPSAHALDELWDLAQRGHLKGIIKKAQQLTEENSQYAEFSKIIHQMAKSFEEKNLVEFIKNHREKKL